MVLWNAREDSETTALVKTAGAGETGECGGFGEDGQKHTRVNFLLMVSRYGLSMLRIGDSK